MPAPLEELWALVESIPSGMVASYGDVGRALHHPASGYFVGRWMTQCPPDVPWWRVVGRDGTLLIAKQNAEAALEQKRRLGEEGVEFTDGRVQMARFRAQLDELP